MGTRAKQRRPFAGEVAYEGRACDAYHDMLTFCSLGSLLAR